MDSSDRVSEMKEHPAIQEALSLLRTQLPATLLYHAYAHTEDVLHEVIELACADGLPARDVELLTIAAAWHDVGFIWQANDNEPLAAEAARRYLSTTEHCTPQEIDLVAQMICDTALIPDGTSLRRVPSHFLSRYLLDADVANFGRDDFFDKCELLRRERGEDQMSFRERTLVFIRAHTWLTPAAHTRWQAKKEANLVQLEKQVAKR